MTFPLRPWDSSVPLRGDVRHYDSRAADAIKNLVRNRIAHFTSINSNGNQGLVVYVHCRIDGAITWSQRLVKGSAKLMATKAWSARGNAGKRLKN